MAYKTIAIQSLYAVQKEALANAIITPGMLIELMSTGKVRAHAGAGQPAAKMFAVEDDLQGKEISDDYAASSKVLYKVFLPGDEVNALIADGENIAIGDWLESNGNGYLREVDAVDLEASNPGSLYTGNRVAIAMEACNRSSSSGGDTNVTGRCRVMIV